MINYEEFRSHMIHDTPKDFGRYLAENVEVANYIPLGKKAAYIDIFAKNFSFVLSNLLEDEYATMADILLEYEMRKVFDIMLRYTNIDFDIKYQNNMEYDLIMQSGFYFYVMTIAREDYDMMCNYLDIAVGIRDMSIIEQITKNLHMPTVSDIKSMVKELNNIEQDKLDKLNHIVDMNDPLTKSVADIVKTAAYTEAINKQNIEQLEDNTQEESVDK